MSPHGMSADQAHIAPLPQLLDRKSLQAETGLPRSGVDAIFESLPVVTLPNHRKVYVRRQDVASLLANGTFRNDGTEVRA